jgi:serine protein kinase
MDMKPTGEGGLNMARFDTSWLAQHQPPTGVWNWEGSFADYLQKVQDNPSVADLAHARIYRMIMSHGSEKPENRSVPQYNFFSRELFGIDETINADFALSNCSLNILKSARK